MKMDRLNCWEFKKCGREPGGAKEHELGTCPASYDARYDGIFGGRNGGRSCWLVAGTMCKGVVEGIFAKKYDDCRKCDFFQLVRNDTFQKWDKVYPIKYVNHSLLSSDIR
jgi:hypothetical protein